jgi:hypothetical protein
VSELEWAVGLRALYNSVLDEPIPDELADLLADLGDCQAPRDTSVNDQA